MTLLQLMNTVVRKFTTLPPDRIIQAWPNRTAYPKEDFCVITMVASVRQGSNNTEYDWTDLDASTKTDNAFHITQIQFSFVGSNASKNAGIISVLGRSATLCDFLELSEVQPIEATAPMDTTVGDGSEQYAVSFATTLTVGHWLSVVTDQDWFNSVILKTEVLQ
jgi:hypothetical protein